MKQSPQRIIINAKDIMLLTGKGERAAYRLMARIRRQHHKPPRSLLTIDEFCAYTGILPNRVINILS